MPTLSQEIRLVDAVDTRRAGLDLSAVPGPLRGIVERMVRPDPNERFATMDAVLEALSAAEVPGATRSPLARWWPVAAGLGAVLLALVGWLSLRPASKQAASAGAVVAADPIVRTRDAINSALPSVSCTWLKILSVTPGQRGARVMLTGVAGDPARAQAEISRTLDAQKLAAETIDFADVAPITRSGCAALDAYRQIRATGQPHLTVAQRRFAMRMQPADQAYPGEMAANAIITITDPGTDFALIGLEPSGKIDMVLPNRAAFASQVRTSQNGIPISDLGQGRYRLQIDLNHLGWSGLLMMSGKGPFEPSVAAPALGQRGADWREKLVDLAAERGWQAEMVWFRSTE